MEKTYWTLERMQEMNTFVHKVKTDQIKTNKYTLEEFIKKAKNQ